MIDILLVAISGHARMPAIRLRLLPSVCAVPRSVQHPQNLLLVDALLSSPLLLLVEVLLAGEVLVETRLSPSRVPTDVCSMVDARVREAWRGRVICRHVLAVVTSLLLLGRRVKSLRTPTFSAEASWPLVSSWRWVPLAGLSWGRPRVVKSLAGSLLQFHSWRQGNVDQ